VWADTEGAGEEWVALDGEAWEVLGVLGEVLRGAEGVAGRGEERGVSVWDVEDALVSQRLGCIGLAVPAPVSAEIPAGPRAHR
jgi:hypothetical protein